MTGHLTRRSVLGGMTAAGAASVLGIPQASATPTLASAYPKILKFRVERDGSPIGHVMERYQPMGEDLRVDVFIAFQVKFAFITVYRYEHRAREIWREGHLVRLDTVTNDDGDPQQVRGRAGSGGLAVEGPQGALIAPAGIFPSSYWHPRFTEQSQMLDSQLGRVLEFDISKVGSERIDVLGQPVDTDRFAMRGDIDLDFWYDAERVWQKMAFTIKGGYMEYTRVAPGPEDGGMFMSPLSTGVSLPSLQSA
ncbi:MAG: DUF6134 family protein [Thalassobaculaceae bacterium]|nr:DUF6134 family protein [Thalassobaculaceae bacterium]